MRTFKALSLLLSYPQEDLKAAMPVIRATLSEEGVLPARPPGGARDPLLDDLAARDLFDLQERYVFLFDRSRSLSLNLFEHVHGDSRARGQAMVDLLETYRAGGYDLVGPELPDHLPVLLEFLSTRPLDEARDILRDAGRDPRGPRRAAAAAGQHLRTGARRARRPRGDGTRFRPGRGAARRRPTTIPTIWKRSTPPGRRRRSPSVPTRTPAAPPAATFSPGWTFRPRTARGSAPAA
jgi:nitrate reductase molybdenum cofactor assembly chaperone